MSVAKKMLLIIVAVAFVISAWAINVMAAENAKLGNLTFSNASVSGTTATMTVSRSGMSGEKSQTFRITNNHTTNSILVEFDYSDYVHGDGDQGSATMAAPVNGTVQSNENGHCKMILQSGGYFEVTIKTYDWKFIGGSAHSYKMENIYQTILYDKTDLTVNYDAALGTVTYNESEVESGSVLKAFPKDDTLKATVAEGTLFLGWVDSTGKIVSSTELYTVSPNANAMTVQPVFIQESSDELWFKVNNAYMYNNLNTAASSAGSGGTIVVIRDGTLPAGNYTIPSGVTLLVPYNAIATLNNNPSPVGTYTIPSAFRTMTMASGAVITVDGGTIHVGSEVSAVGQNADSWNGTPSGPHGKIHMEEGSSIVLQNKAALYAFGYISGSGEVRAKTGTMVQECFQIRDWRGGTVTCGSATNALAGKVNELFTNNDIFPINQYYIQNVEAKLVIESGAVEKIYAACNAAGNILSTTTTFIGDGGMFVLDAGAILTKSYDSTRDYLHIVVDGNSTMTSMALSFDIVISKMDLDTASYVMPLSSNMSITANTGSITVKQDLALLPGHEIYVKHNAGIILNNGVRLYVYDQENWGNYATDLAALSPVGYSAANGTTVVRTADDLKDVYIDINGTVTVNGGFYTTAGGANLTSSEGTGKVTVNAVGSETNTYQVVIASDASPQKVNIPITPAKLKNADGTYVQTVANTYMYAHGMWHEGTTVPVIGEETVTAPTCEDRGYTSTSCNICGDVKYNYVDALGHKDADGDGDHICDVEGCGATATSCVDDDKNHVCNECNGAVGTCGDGNKDHTCDYGCGKSYGEHTDGNKDHACDYGCSEKIGMNLHADSAEDEDHVCDYGCGEVLENCSGGNATCQAQATCSVCNQKYGSVNAENHTGNAEWTQTTTDHTKTYSCCSATAVPMEPHEWSNGVCSECEYTCTHEGAIVTDKAVAATCTATGLTEGSHCDICKKVIVEQTTIDIDENAHRWGEWKQTTAPTCTNAGEETRVCEHNAEHKEKQPVEKVSHSMTAEAAKAATCVATGNHAYWYCSSCDTYYKDEAGTEAYAENAHVIAIDPEAHAWNEGVVTTNPTCSATGVKTYTCTHNGEHTKTEEVAIDANAHAWSEGVVTTQPTCSAKGVKTYTCTHNGEHTKTEDVAVDPTKHTNTRNVAAEEANCTDTGYTAGVYCDDCKTYISGHELVDIQPDAHSFTNYVSDNNASCTEDGTKTAKCDRCEATDTITDEGTQLDHSYAFVDKSHVYNKDENGEYVSCTVTGECSSCGAKTTAVSTGISSRVTTEATCQTEGQIEYTFTYAEAWIENGAIVKTFNIGKGAHDTTHVPAAAPTCGADGTKEHWKCNTCGKLFSDAEGQTEITDVVDPATGNHNYATETERKEATCTEDGYYILGCACGATETHVISANGHSYEAVVTAPNCTEGGYTTYTCACGDKYVADEVAALGHTAGTAVKENEVAASCGAAGSYDSVVYCSVCGAEISRETVEVPATGEHNYATETERKEASCTEDGYYILGCACGATETHAIPKTDHSYEAVVTAPNCTEGGYTTYTCACGDKYVADEVAALGHTAGTAVKENEVAASCGAAGSYDSVVYCSVCGAEISRETVEVPATGNHSYDNDCDTSCNVCGDVRTITHNYGTEWKHDETSHWHECACGEKSDLAGHAYTTETDRKDPTCKDNGYVVKTCECGKTERTVLAATGNHNWTDGTCTTCQTVCAHETYEDGKCTVCEKAATAIILDNGASLLLEGMVQVKQYLSFTDEQGKDLDPTYVLNNAGVEVTYYDGSIVNHKLERGGTYGGLTEYFIRSEGIPTRYLDVALKIRPYIEIGGTTIYGSTRYSVYQEYKEYGVMEYTANKMPKTQDEKLKATLAALLNYGAAMQQYKKDPAPYMNECLQTFVDDGYLNAEYLNLNWSDALIALPEQPSADMSINFLCDGTIKDNSRSLFLEGEVSVRYYKGLGDDYTKFEGSTTVMYFWTEAQYQALKAANTPLTKENASYYVEYEDFDQPFEYDSRYPQYGYECAVRSQGFAANELGDVVYSALVVTCSDNTEYYSGVEVYGPKVYANSKLNDGKENQPIDKLCQWMMVYGERSAILLAK